MGWSQLNTNLYNLINNNKATLSIQEVSAFPKLKFDGYPACHISPSDNPSEFETTSENLRDYVFKVRLFESTKDQGLDGAMSNLRARVDGLIDLIDQEGYKSNSSFATSLGANETYIFTFAVPGVWGLLNDEALVFSELTVKIRLSIDVS
jgi:hypothetical protein